MATTNTARCAICKQKLNPRKATPQPDGRYLCVSCRSVADLVDDAAQRATAAEG